MKEYYISAKDLVGRTWYWNLPRGEWCNVKSMATSLYEKDCARELNFVKKLFNLTFTDFTLVRN